MIKTKRNRKWKIPYTVLERRTLGFSLYKNRKLKKKLWRVGDRERIKRALFVLFIFSEGIFFNICVLSQCILYWIHFQNIHTFTYQKTLLNTLLLLVFKFIESLQRIFKGFIISHCIFRRTIFPILTIFIIQNISKRWINQWFM